MPSSNRTMPARLRELRERDPNAFIAACKRGGKNAAKRRKQSRNAENETREAILAEIQIEIRLSAAAIAAAERRDHLLPDP